MIRITFIFVVFLFPIYADSVIDELKTKCLLEPNQSKSNDVYKDLVRTMEFEKAKDYCDQLPNDPKNCRASSRFWLAAKEYAEGNFSAAETYFQEGLALKKSNKVIRWIAYKENKSGWGNPEDMLKYARNSKELSNSNPKYIQTLTYLIVDQTDTTFDQTVKKHIKMKMDPCLAVHGYLSLNVLKRNIELFTKKQLTIDIKSIYITQTATKLNEKNYIMLSGLKPWDEKFSLQMNQIASESDLIFISFPRFGGNANANFSSIPIVPKLANSPFRTYIKMPSEWLTMFNFPQIFHEYMHTVEFNMKRNGDKKFHATSHGSDGKRVEEITGLPTETTGETDWAEHLFANRIQELSNQLDQKKSKNGWEEIFGIHIQNKNKFSNDEIMELFKIYKSKESELPVSEDSN